MDKDISTSLITLGHNMIIMIKVINSISTNLFHLIWMCKKSRKTYKTPQWVKYVVVQFGMN